MKSVIPVSCRFILLLILLLELSFCGEKRKSTEKNGVSKYELPALVRASAPYVTRLDTCSRPYLMTFPEKGKQNSYTILVNNKRDVVSVFTPEVHSLTGLIAGEYAFEKNYNAEQELVIGHIACGYSDKMGNLWFGSYGSGVSRYDGKSVTNYTTAQGLAGNLVRCITEDKNGNLWFGTSGSGVSKYDGKSFTTYTTSDGLAGNTVKSIIEDKDGDIWLGTEYGVSKYLPSENGRKGQKIFVNYIKEIGFVTGSIEDRLGNLWFATRTSGVSKYDGASFTNYTTDQGLISNDVTGVAEDKDGNIWFATTSGVSKYTVLEQNETGENRFTNYTVADGLANNNVQSINADKDGNIWLGTGSGLSKFELSGKHANSKKGFVNYTTEQGLANNTVHSITKDKRGDLWFGMSGGGLNKYNAKFFTTYTTDQGLINNKVWAITEDKEGNLLFGTSAGITRYNGKEFTNISIRYVTSNVRSIIKDKEGKLWWGNTMGMSEYDGKIIASYTHAQGFVSEAVLCCFEDAKGNLWFGTYGKGVVKYDGTIFTRYTTAHGLANDNIKSIIEDNNGNLWFGTNGNGISKYDGKSFTNYTTAQGLANNSILSCIKDKAGNLWFGTFGGGASRFDGKTFKNYTTADGLANDVVYAIAEDTLRNMLWFGTNVGLSGLKLRTAFSSDSILKFENFNNTTGYSIKDVNTGALYVDKEGIIWAGTSDRLIRFSYDAIHKSSEKPQVFMYNLKIQGEKISWYNLEVAKTGRQTKRSTDSLKILNDEITAFGKTLADSQRVEMVEKFGDVLFDSITPFYPIPQNLVLPYEHNNVTIDFGVVETDRPQLIRYSYLLEGYDNKWSPVTAQTAATFGNINEGVYTFKLKAQSPDGVWSEPLLYTFKVLPPWYRTWWMYLSYLFSVVSAIALFFRWRTAALRKDKERLEHQVKKRTSEVVEQKKLVEKKNELIEEKQKEILDSINYAKRIQYALLAHEEVLKKHFENHFVFFQPKDIVSGDFYWATEVKPKEKFLESGETQQSSSFFYLAVCDSTGHGVPGAFMSLLNISFLNEAINEKNIRKPNEILNHVRQRLIENISQDGAQDGMDGILLCFEYFEGIDNAEQNVRITYAAANNSPVLIRNESFVEQPYDRMPVGKGEKEESFTLHTISVEKGDMIYCFTDGYADQFGGPKGKKFKNKQLNDLLLTIHQQSMKKQRQSLSTTIENWRAWATFGGKTSHIEEQVDDVLIIGFKID